MVDKSKVLQIAQRKIANQGFVDYNDFIELRPKDKAGGHWLQEVKKILLDAGYKCHEARHKRDWRGTCSYRESRTHFHKNQ